MAVALLEQDPLGLADEVGPYRRADYVRLPDEPRCELIYGRLFMSPSPMLVHQVTVFVLSRFLDDVAARSGGRAFVAPLDVHLAEHSVVQPDVMYVSPARSAILAERIEGAPDLVVEVLSDGTARRDRGDKLRLYAESGVREYWLVDPAARQIEFLVAESGRFVVALPVGERYRSTALPEIVLDLGPFWADVDRRLP